MESKIFMNLEKTCPGEVHVVESGDTLYSIAQKHHTRVRNLLFLNPFVDIYNLQPGEELCVPEEGTPPDQRLTPYVVKKGDTLGKILKDTKLTFEELSAKNPQLRELKPDPGLILFIPEKTNDESTAS